VSPKEIVIWLEIESKEWYRRFENFLMYIRFLRSSYDNCVYILKREEESILLLLLYVGDILIANQYKNEIEELKEKSSEFEVKILVRLGEY